MFSINIHSLVLKSISREIKLKIAEGYVAIFPGILPINSKIVQTGNRPMHHADITASNLVDRAETKTQKMK